MWRTYADLVANVAGVRWRRAVAYGLAVVAACAGVALLDRAGSSDDAGMVTLAAIVVLGFALGAAAPRWAWVAGACLGVAIFASDAAALALSAPHGPIPNPGGLRGAATLLVLLVPAGLAAFAGAGVRIAASHS